MARIGSVPPVWPVRADPQRYCDLPGFGLVCEHLCGLQPLLLSAGPAFQSL